MTTSPTSPRSLPTGYQLELTESMRQGRSRVEQCSWCGLLAATVESTPAALGRCPACGCETWWRQTLPVGPFRAHGLNVDLEVVWAWFRRWKHGPLPYEGEYEASKARALAELTKILGGAPAR